MSPHAPRAVLRLLPDEPLGRLAAGGSEPAFDVLYARHAAGLTASCRRILRNDEDARDAVQSTMLKAWASLGRRGDAPLRPWLYRIAHNESVSLLRRRRPVAELPAGAAASTDVHAAATDRADLARAISGIGALPPRQREALLMRVLGEASYDDIAATLQTSPAAARQSVTSARRTLRRRRLAGVLPIPAWLTELAALANSGSTVLTGQVTGRAAATLTAAVATVGVVHGPLDEQTPKVRAAARQPAAQVAQARTGGATAAAARASAPAVTATVAAPSAASPASGTVRASPRSERTTTPQRSQEPAPAQDDDAPASDEDVALTGDEGLPPDSPRDEESFDAGPGLMARHGPSHRSRDAPGAERDAWTGPSPVAGEDASGPPADEVDEPAGEPVDAAEPFASVTSVRHPPRRSPDLLRSSSARHIRLFGAVRVIGRAPRP